MAACSGRPHSGSCSSTSARWLRSSPAPSRGAAATLPLLWWITGGLGICLGYHRLLTHRSFKTSKFLEHVFATLGALCWQGGPLHWVGTHRLHHAESDGDLDPHSPQHGFTWSHILWCFHRRPDGRDPFAVTKDLARDPYLVWLDRWFLLPQVALAAVLYGIGFWATGTGMGALGYVIWGVCVRTIFCFHATWFVNSARTRGATATSEPPTAAATRGGWRCSPSAKAGTTTTMRSSDPQAHGMRWWELDPTWWTIRVLERLGLVHSVVRPKLDRLDPHR